MPDGQVGAPADAAQKRLGRVPAPAATLVHLEVIHAFVIAGIEIAGARNPGLHRRVPEVLQHTPFQALGLHPPLAVATVKGVVPPAVQPMAALLSAKIRQAGFPAPVRIAGDGGPVLVVAGLATDIKHAVDAGAAAQHLATGIDQRATVEAGAGVGAKAPVGARVVDAVEVTHRNMNPVVIVAAAGLDQQHPVGRVGAEPVGQQTTGGAGADHHVIVPVGCGLADGGRGVVVHIVSPCRQAHVTTFAEAGHTPPGGRIRAGATSPGTPCPGAPGAGTVDPPRCPAPPPGRSPDRWPPGTGPPGRPARSDPGPRRRAPR